MLICDRLLDLLLLKQDVANHLLTERLNALAIPVDVKTILRETLSTVGAYRLAMGEPHYDAVSGSIVAGRSSEQVDFTWRGALGILGSLFLEFVEAVVNCYLVAFINCCYSAVVSRLLVRCAFTFVSPGPGLQEQA